jgi:hypothetical protein
MWLILPIPQLSTVAVFFAFPLFIVFILPYTFLFASISKLFYSEPLYMEMFVLNTVFMLPEVFGHSDVFYEKASRKKWINGLSFIFCNGTYHYMHHSAEKEDSVIARGLFKGRDRKVNMINMGGGFCFIWDHLFGTYKSLRETRPRVGLIDCPQLHMNPMRLALSGPAQLIYEWKENKSWKTRFKILFGPSDFEPAISKDYAIKLSDSSNQPLKASA